MAISFVSKLSEFQLNRRNLYTKWLAYIIKEHNKRLGEILYTFVNDKEILEINRNFLNHNYLTDIITFDTSFLDTVSGEIYISLETVFSNAIDHSEGIQQSELERVLVHGVLHLLGYKDSTDEEKHIMRSKENNCLDILNKEDFKE